MHYDEPFWMVRGDFLIRSLIEGNLEDLQNNHWMLAPMEGERRIFNSYIATGSGTAFLTGLGRLFIPLAPGGEGIGGLVAELFFSRLLHVLCSALTPLLLLLLARRLGLPWMGQIALLSYFTFDPHPAGDGKPRSSRVVLDPDGPGCSSALRRLPPAAIAAPLSRRRRGVRSGFRQSNQWWGRCSCGSCIHCSQAAITAARLAERPESSLEGRCSARFTLPGGVGCVCTVFSSPLEIPGVWLYRFSLSAGGLDGVRCRLRGCGCLSVDGSGLRFLFVLFGLAGSCTVAYALDRWGPHSAKVARLVAGTILVLSMWAATSIVIRQQDSLRRTRDFYGKLHARNFSRIDVPRFPASYIRTDADP